MVPLATPVTTPVEEPTVAMPVLALDHVPPPELERVVVAFTHTTAVPVMADGNGLIVAVIVVDATPHELEMV